MNRSPEICQERDRRVMKNSAVNLGKKSLVKPFEGYMISYTVFKTLL